MDSHVLFRPGALARLVEYLEAHPTRRICGKGRLLGDDLKPSTALTSIPCGARGCTVCGRRTRAASTRTRPRSRSRCRGLGVFGCRRAAWPGFNPRLRGFGGEEGYLHEKVRRAGGRTLCLPFLGWVHRFGRPLGPRYAVAVEDRVRNYLLVHDELGLDPGPAIDHFEQEFGAEPCGRSWIAWSKSCGALSTSSTRSTASTSIARRERWESVMRQGKALGIDQRIRRFAAIDTPARPSHRMGPVPSRRRRRGEVAGPEECPRPGGRRPLLAPDRGGDGAEPGRAGRAGVGPAVPGRTPLGPGTSRRRRAAAYSRRPTG